ncbi:MAG: ThiF family adenylyltransferase [Clostridia bacterium]|nr:ThiF family adenylyltransferase [Clostridia bacterium]MBR5987755.1 ThiF family adenylyltransferase [Clostridia bacterium]
MEKATDRLTILIGEQGVDRLAAAKVAVVGLGGVGGQAAEAIARSFVGSLVLVDGDKVNASNCNRQILASAKTVGKEKALVAADRVKEINPDAEVLAQPLFVTAENVASLPIWDADCVVDAIDDVDAKVALIKEARARGVKIVSSMGAANRFDPMAFKVADISETHTCPLAKKIRKLLAEQGITKGVTVVYSTEKPLSFGGALGSNAFVPPAAGLLVASAAVNLLLKDEA